MASRKTKAVISYAAGILLALLVCAVFLFLPIHLSVNHRLNSSAYIPMVYESTEAVLSLLENDRALFEQTAYLLMENASFFRRESNGAMGWGSYDAPEETYAGDYYTQENGDRIVELWHRFRPQRIASLDHYDWPVLFYFRLKSEQTEKMVEAAIVFFGEKTDLDEIERDLAIQTRRGKKATALGYDGWYLLEPAAQ